MRWGMLCFQMARQVLVRRIAGRPITCVVVALTPLCSSLQVLVQRIAGPSSHFATYISYLPVGVSGVPMFFPREALEAIEYPPVVEQVRASAVLYCNCYVHGGQTTDHMRPVK
jgi:hypothetical protein